MQRLIYASLMASSLVAWAGLAACSSSSSGTCGDGITDPGEQCDDGAANGTAGDACSATCTLVGGGVGHIMANWQLADIDAGGNTTATACPPGFDTAALHTVAASPDGTALDPCTSVNSNCYIDLFNCSDSTGVSSDLPAQNYLTWVEITSHDGSSVYATSTAAFVDITNQDLAFNTQILNNGGYFRLSWTLMGETSGQTLACSATAAASSAGGSVETTATVTGGSTAFSDKFNCEDHFGYSAGLPEGSYTVQIDALDSTNAALGPGTTLTDKQITAPNGITDLGDITIPISGQ